MIHVLPDEAVKCSAVLESMLPRESNSKETDAGLLPVIGFPAFAVNSEETIEVTVATLRAKLQGRYGLKRFLRDGYKTLREDTGRLHYEPWELRVFDNIECEWPLFLCLVAINHQFSGEGEEAGEILQLLDNLSVPHAGILCLPELYLVPEERMIQVKDLLYFHKHKIFRNNTVQVLLTGSQEGGFHSCGPRVFSPLPGCCMRVCLPLPRLTP